MGALPDAAPPIREAHAPLAPLDALRAARAVLREHGGEDVMPVAWAIDAMLAHGIDFAMALGLAPGWHGAQRQRQRDRALRALAERYAPLTGRPLAKQLASDASRYERTRWPRDRSERRRPGGADGLLYDVLSLGPMPAEETLRKIIG